MDIFGVDLIYIILLIIVAAGGFVIAWVLKKIAKWIALGLIIFIVLIALGFVSASWIPIDAIKGFLLEWVPKLIHFVISLLVGLGAGILAL